jgi:hypothetical protein
MIELQGDQSILDPRLQGGQLGSAPMDQMLAMTATERIGWHARWQHFVRLCERRGETPEEIATSVYGDSPANASR